VALGDIDPLGRKLEPGLFSTDIGGKFTMKKLLKKRFLIPLAVVAALAIGGVAYAAWTSQASTAQTLTTGNVPAITWGSGATIPSTFLFYPASGPSSTYAWTNDKAGYVHPITVTNNNSSAMPLTFQASVTGTLASADLSQIHVQITAAGPGTGVMSPATVSTTLASLVATPITIDSSLAVGATDTIAVTVWLDVNAPTTMAGLTGTVYFTGTFSVGDAS
jgi:predicted ribosomally synthesized peptide with SipW-like signal peptide